MPTETLTTGGQTYIAGGTGRWILHDDSPGDNIITLHSGPEDQVTVFQASHDVITLGNGSHDFVQTGRGGSFGGSDNTVNLGNGNDDTVYDFQSRETPSPFYDTITMGAGARDLVVLTTSAHDTHTDSPFITGVAHVTFGGPDATLDLRSTSGPSFFPATTAGQTSVDADRLDVIGGLVKGDHIHLSGFQAPNTDVLGTSHGLAGVPGEALFATGTYSASVHTFTESAAGQDALLTFDDGTHHFLSVVLVGAAHEIAGSTIHDGTITLG